MDFNQNPESHINLQRSEKTLTPTEEVYQAIIHFHLILGSVVIVKSVIAAVQTSTKYLRQW